MTDLRLLNAIRRHLNDLKAEAPARAKVLYGAVRMAVEYDAVPIDLPKWIGWPPSDAERMRAYRALARLEAAGKVQRVKLGIFRSRFSHVIVGGEQ